MLCCSVYNDDYDSVSEDYDPGQEYIDYVIDDRPGPEGRNPFRGKRISVDVTVTCKKKQRRVIPVRDWMCAPLTTHALVARGMLPACICLACSLQLRCTPSEWTAKVLWDPVCKWNAQALYMADLDPAASYDAGCSCHVSACKAISTMPGATAPIGAPPVYVCSGCPTWRALVTQRFISVQDWRNNC